MSSVHELIPWAGHVNYAASKGGVMQMMKSIAQEVADKKIRVNSIAPGAIKTNINKQVWSTPEGERKLDLVPFGGNWAISVSGNWRYKGCRGLRGGPPARRARDRGRDPRFLPGRRPAPSLLTAAPSPSTAGACDVTWTRHLAVQTLRLPRARPTE
jgi:NAD(P)-dependent dehydrogenase (short-subunit alcohol dehydrogenase family)